MIGSQFTCKNKQLDFKIAFFNKPGSAKDRLKQLEYDEIHQLIAKHIAYRNM